MSSWNLRSFCRTLCKQVVLWTVLSNLCVLTVMSFAAGSVPEPVGMTAFFLYLTLPFLISAYNLYRLSIGAMGGQLKKALIGVGLALVQYLYFRLMMTQEFAIIELAVAVGAVIGMLMLRAQRRAAAPPIAPADAQSGASSNSNAPPPADNEKM